MEKKQRKINRARQVSKKQGPLRLVVGILILLLAVAAWRTASTHSPMASATVAASPPEPSPSKAIFLPTVPNPDPTPDSPPQGMAWIPGGEFSMGAQDAPDTNDVAMHATTDTRPIHRVYVDSFWMDTTDVTNDDFANFAKSTGYLTVAERTPRAEDFPGAPLENLVAGSVVFSPPNHPVPLNDHFQWWSYIPVANWRHPLGPRSNIKGREKYPDDEACY